MSNLTNSLIAPEHVCNRRTLPACREVVTGEFFDEGTGQDGLVTRASRSRRTPGSGRTRPVTRTPLCHAGRPGARRGSDRPLRSTSAEHGRGAKVHRVRGFMRGAHRACMAARHRTSLRIVSNRRVPRRGLRRVCQLAVMAGSAAAVPWRPCPHLRGSGVRRPRPSGTPEYLDER